MSKQKTERNKEIVEKRQNGATFRALATFYNLNVSTIFMICKKAKKVVDRK